MVKNAIYSLCGIILLSVMTACATISSEKLVCPVTGYITDTDYITKKQPGTEDILYRAYFNRVYGFCKNKGDDLELEVAVHIKGGYYPDIAATQKKDFEIPYFVTILDDQSNLLIKHNFTAMVQVNNEGYGEAQTRQKLRIPRTNLGKIDQAQILVGMQLTADELATNRKEGRF